jgi:c-di-AMP phosphodiesterase-like protein
MEEINIVKIGGKVIDNEDERNKFLAKLSGIKKNIILVHGGGKVANQILTIKDIDAAFVIARIAEDAWAVSGRSNGNINVQIILEKMGGGGHFTAAGLQRTASSVASLNRELKKAVEEYLEGVEANEGNSAE